MRFGCGGSSATSVSLFTVAVHRQDSLVNSFFLPANLKYARLSVMTFVKHVLVALLHRLLVVCHSSSYQPDPGARLCLSVFSHRNSLYLVPLQHSRTPKGAFH